jgi:Mrp family chromosome partitioning ATPase
MPAGEAVINPLELLNLREVKLLLDRLPAVFSWIILDSPPLLFAADANLLSTLCHGTLLVVRIGQTAIDSVTRAMQSLCNNNVLGIVVNGARRGELYSKYTYYHSYYAPKEEQERQEYEAEQARKEGKPENIIGKMVEGRLRNFFAERVLLEQPFVKDDKLTVGKYAQEHGMKVLRYIHWELGK